MRNLLVFLILALAAGISLAASPPSWVQPGVAANYEVISSFYEEGQPQPNGGAQGTVEIMVSQVSGKTVTGTVTVIIPAAMKTDQYPLNCVEGSAGAWRFWVDPSDPTNSAVGPNGEKMELIGRGPIEYYGGTAQDATMIGYSNKETGASFRYTFDSRTGLVYAYVEDFPTQKTYMYYRSINVDLSSYQPPAGIPQQTQALPPIPSDEAQTGTGTAGQQSGAQGTTGTAPTGTTGQPSGVPPATGGQQPASQANQQNQTGTPGGNFCAPAAALLMIAGFAAWRKIG